MYSLYWIIDEKLFLTSFGKTTPALQASGAREFNSIWNIFKGHASTASQLEVKQFGEPNSCDTQILFSQTDSCKYPHCAWLAP